MSDLRTVWWPHPAHIVESRHTYNWSMSHIWMGHVTHINESCHTELKRIRVLPFVWILTSRVKWCVRGHKSYHVTHMHESCHTYEWVMSHVWISHVTRINESWHTRERVMSHPWTQAEKLREQPSPRMLTCRIKRCLRGQSSCHVTHLNESWHTHVTQVNEWCHTTLHTGDLATRCQISVAYSP